MKEREAREEEGPVLGEADILEIVVVEVMEQWEGGAAGKRQYIMTAKKKKDN